MSSAVAIAEGGKSPIDSLQLEERYDGQALDQLALPIDLDTLAVALPTKSTSAPGVPSRQDGNGVVAVSFAKASAEGENGAAIAVSDDVNVVVNGDVKAKKTGVFAASIADADSGDQFELEEQGDVSVTVNKGRVIGGAGYYGIVVLGGDRTSSPSARTGVSPRSASTPSLAATKTRLSKTTAWSMATSISASATAPSTTTPAEASTPHRSSI